MTTLDTVQNVVIYHGYPGTPTLGELTLRTGRFEFKCDDVAYSLLKRALDALERPVDGHREMLLGKVLGNDLLLWTDFLDVRLKLLAADPAQLFEVSLTEEEARGIAHGLREIMDHETS